MLTRVSAADFPSLHKNLIFAHWLNSDIVTSSDDTLPLCGQMQHINMYQTPLTPQRIFAPQIVNNLPHWTPAPHINWKYGYLNRNKYGSFQIPHFSSHFKFNCLQYFFVVIILVPEIIFNALRKYSWENKGNVSLSDT